MAVSKSKMLNFLEAMLRRNISQRKGATKFVGRAFTVQQNGEPEGSPKQC